MNKRLGLLSLFGITVLLLSMVGAIAALAAPSAAAVDGSFVANAPKAWYKDGSVIRIRISDADRNVSTTRSNETITVPDLGAAGSVVVFLANLPVISASVTINDATSTVAILESNPLILEAVVESEVQGRVRITAGAGGYNPDGNATIDLTVNYKQSITNVLDDPADPGNPAKLLMKVTTSQNSTGFLVLMSEVTVPSVVTDAGTPATNSGVFEGKVTLVTTPAGESGVVTDTKIRIALTGDLVTFAYTDKTPADTTLASKVIATTATVDLTKPTIGSITPADKLSTTLLKPEFKATFADSHSGVDANTLSLILLDKFGTALATTCTTSVYTLTCKPTLDLVEANSPHTWQFVGNDVAGNTGKTDADTTTAGDQTYTITLDTAPPTSFTAKTGIWWDTAKLDTVVGDDAVVGNKSEFTASKAKNTSMRLQFNEKILASTVEAGDFTVAGNTVTEAKVYAKAENFVFLTLGTAIGSADKPKVTLAGAVSDLAGNSRLGLAEVTPTDGIGPKITTLSVDKTLIKSDQSVVITIVSDEAAIGNQPSKVEIYKALDAVTPELVVTATAISTGTNTWTVTVKGTDLGDAGIAAGQKKAVYVEVTDSANNAGTKGSKDTAATTAVVFTVDKTLPIVVTFDPADATNVYTSTPFITLTWSEKVTVSKLEFGENGTTLTDVTAQLGPITTDFKVTFKASGLVVDKKYDVKVAAGNAIDVVGNKLAADAKVTFTAKAPPTTDIALKPGANLVSFPSDPKDGDPNTVFGTNVTSVVTYDAKNPDPATGSPWLTATRGTDGKLSGSLKKIDSRHAYFVNSSSFATVKVNLVKLGVDAPPPIISLVKGWNLVSVVSVEGKAPGALISSDAYLGTVKWTTAYSYDTVLDAWVRIQPKSFANLVVGVGYWVYLTEDGTLIP